MTLPAAHESSRRRYSQSTISISSTLTGNSDVPRRNNLAVDGDENDDNKGTQTRSRSESSRQTNRTHMRSLRLIRSLSLISPLSFILLALVALNWGVSVGVECKTVNGIFAARWQSLGEDVEILVDTEILVDKSALVPRSPLPAENQDDLPSSIKRSSGTPAVKLDNSEGSSVLTNPTAFDTVSLSTNLTSDCSHFLTLITTDEEFKNCLPLSGFIRDSTSFFNIMKQGAFKTTQIMDRICAVNFNRCQALMESFSGQLRESKFCEADYDAQNPVAEDMFTMLITYKPLYTAGCLKATDGDYCFVDAATNIERPEDLYIYSLPLGNPLPGGSRPTCNDCLTRTMAVFSAVAGNSTQPLSNTYIPAAEQLNIGCGPNYVNPQVETSIASSKSASMSLLVLSVVMVATAAFAFS